MAEKITDADPTAAPKGDNSESRSDAHRALLKKMLPIEAKIDKLKTDLKEARKSWSADTNMTLGDFDAARRLATIEDDDQRKEKVGAHMEIFNALCAGEQMDFLSSAHYPGDAP